MIRAIVLAVVLVGCGAARDPMQDVPTLEVAPRDRFVRQVRAEGVLRAVEATPVLAPRDADGPLKIAWVAQDGATVKAGDVVIRFDPTEMQRTLADSEDDVSTAKHQIHKSTLDGGASRNKRDLTAELAEHEAVVARSFDTKDEKILSRVEIAEGTIDLELAEAKAVHARKVQKVERSVSASQLELHEISRSQHSREAAHARDGLGRLEVVAPHPGVLVLSRDWRGELVRIGDTVWAGQKLAELPLVAKLEAEVFVLEVDAGELATGLAAEVVVDAHPELVWAAKIARVDTLAQPRHPEVPVNYFGVTLALEQTDAEHMRVGQRVRATIAIEQPDAIVVPRQAVFDRDGKSVVYRAADAGFEAVEVTLGKASTGRVVITAGIEPGCRIALRDPNRAASELLGGSDDGAAKRAPERTPERP
jgi:HlyD family secretion protein